jgi:cytidyltransferase-like protein
MKETIKRLYLLQIKEGGIFDDVYHFLPENEQQMLEEAGVKFFLKEEYRKKIIVVMTGGVFDIIHAGHIYTLNEAKKLGDVLIVAVAKDEHVKKRKPIHSLEYRTMIVDFLKPVDLALPGTDHPKKLLEIVKPDVIVYGYDQAEFIKPENIQVVKLKEQIEDGKFKTSKIIKELGL